MIPRKDFLKSIDFSFEVAPVCGILGPRQCGKTSLAKEYLKNYTDKVHFFDLEDPLELSILDNPKLALESLEGLIVIDEIQRKPELFQIIRVLVDRYNKQFLILGSASRELIRQSSESLAGRINYIEMTPFSITETNDLYKTLCRGGFPRSYLAKNDKTSIAWRKSYVRTFLEQDVRNLGIELSSEIMKRFWMMITHYHGQILNNSEISRSLNITTKTVTKYFDILIGTFMLRKLSPWFENMKKRQIKSPKIYFRDSGILNYMLSVNNKEEMLSNPKIGFLWEGFALEEIIRKLKAEPENCYFWKTQSGAELDLLIIHNGKRLGFEIKYTDSPKLTKSMLIAMENLKLDELTVIIPSKGYFKLHEKVMISDLDTFVKHCI